MSRALSSGSAPPWLAQQFQAGCLTLTACATLAWNMARLSPTAAFKLSTACSLPLGPGAVLLEQAMQQAVLPAQRGPRSVLATLCSGQLSTVAACVVNVLAATRQPGAVTAFASSTAKPGVLLTWLHLVTRVLVGSLAADAYDSALDERQSVLAMYAFLVGELVTSEPYAKHREQLASDAVLQLGVVHALMGHCRPGLAGDVRADLAAEGGLVWGARSARLLRLLPDVLQHPCFKAAVWKYTQLPGVLAALQGAADVVAALPLRGDGGSTQLSATSTIGLLHCRAVQLLAICCRIMVGRLMQEQEEASGGSQPAADAAPGQGSSSGGSQPAADAAPGQGSGSRAAASGAACDDQRHTMAWQLVAVVPRLAALLEAVAGSVAESNANAVNVESMCVHVATVVSLLSCLHKRPATPAQLASWAEAAAAGVRLQPLLLQFDASFRQLSLHPQDSRAVGEGAEQLSLCFLQHLSKRMPRCVDSGSAPGTPSSIAARQRLVVALWQLHSAHARLCHWVLSQDGPALAGLPTYSRQQVLCYLLGGLATKFEAAHNAMPAWRLDGVSPDPPARHGAATQLQALCAAHVETLAALVAAVDADAAAGRLDTRSQQLCCAALIDGLPRISSCPSTSTPSLHAAIDTVAGMLAQNAELRKCWLVYLPQLAEAAAGSRHLAVAIASGRLLGMLLQAAAELHECGGSAVDQQATALLDDWAGLIAAVANAASSAVEDAATIGTPDSLVAELKQGAHSLRQQRQQVLHGLPADASPAERAAQLQQLVQPAKQLADLLHQWWQLREPSRRLLLDQGRAAAARSCAYLRCANVAGQGGPAAGQGVGSARCSACRAVWYCGTACSHADWRAGHKRVCNALAEERQAAKAARASAAAAEAGAAQ